MNRILSPGSFLQSTGVSDDDYFGSAKLFIAANDATGAFGFVINRLYERKFNELVEFSDCPPLPLYTGGPVDGGHIYFLHNRPELIGEGKPVKDNIYLGGNFKEAVACLQKGTITDGNIRLFIGYCGWDAGELENEIAEGSWEPVSNSSLF